GCSASTAMWSTSLPTAPALPVSDPHDRELTISCGCALFNIRVAAAAAKLDAAVDVCVPTRPTTTTWRGFYWTFNATLRENGSPVVTRGRETQIYRRENGQWRIVHIHYSSMPAPARATTAASAPLSG